MFGEPETAALQLKKDTLWSGCGPMDGNIPNAKDICRKIVEDGIVAFDTEPGKTYTLRNL